MKDFQPTSYHRVETTPLTRRNSGGLAHGVLLLAVQVAAAALLVSFGEAAHAATQPKAAFTHSMKDLTVAVDASASRLEGARFAWDFGDGATSEGVTATHTYERAGSYTIELTVTERAGKRDTASTMVTPRLTNRGPTASFRHVISGLRISVNASESSDPEGPIYEYAWDFGDGETSTGVQASHAYAKPGTYRVTLTVSDYRGATDRAAPRITVSAPRPPGAAEED